jgi:UDP-2-acetamido-2-deoxy-ribo-hexuluronate aminotransferase
LLRLKLLIRMEDIKMVNTKAQYGKLKLELDDAFSAVMGSMNSVENTQVDDLARHIEQILKVQNAFPCANGKDALLIAIRALKLPLGSEVIVPSFNYDAGATILILLGLKPVFVDVDLNTFTIDPKAIVNALSPQTAAIIPVHLFGQCAPMQEIMEIAEKHALSVIEDATLAFGAHYRFPDGAEVKAGTIGHIGVTSFFPTKPLTGMGDGGAVLTNDEQLAATIQQILTTDLSGSEIAAPLRIDAGLDRIQAAMLHVKIKYIDEYNASRQKIAKAYDMRLSSSALIQTPFQTTYSTHIYQQYTIKVSPEVRNALQEHLFDNHIPSAVYYPEPLHLNKKLGALDYQEGFLPNAELLSRSVLSLPLHSELKEDQLEYICNNILAFIS